MIQKVKILIAEDEILVARVLQMQLEKIDFEVKHVIDEEDAFNIACEFNPDTIILDICLKNNTSGIQAANRIREYGINCLIIFTTGNSLEQTKIDIQDISNSTVLIKPIEVNEILDCISLIKE